MLKIEREIESQPRIWRQAAGVAANLLDGIPEPGQRLAIIGCGTSYYIAQAMASLREGAGQGESDAFTASEAPLRRPYDVVLAVSRSGTTTEVLTALDRVPAGIRTVAISATPNSPIPTAASRAVVLEFADEESVVQTRFATAALAFWRAVLEEAIEPLAAAAEEVLGTAVRDDLESFDHFVFLGSGWGVGMASEAALKLREAAGAWTEAYPAMEYRHGPVSATTSHTLVWGVGPVDGGVLADAAQAGAEVIESRRDPMVELVAIQRAAVALAKTRGRDPDEPRHLSRSVVLEAGT